MAKRKKVNYEITEIREGESKMIDISQELAKEILLNLSNNTSSNYSDLMNIKNFKMSEKEANILTNLLVRLGYGDENILRERIDKNEH